MPIRINEQMPVVKRLEEEQIFVMHESRAASQDRQHLLNPIMLSYWTIIHYIDRIYV